MPEPSVLPTPRYTGDIPTPYTCHVEEFQELFEKRFGVRPSSEQALKDLISLLVIVNYQQENALYQLRQTKQR